ncbi:MAG: protein-tyrosine-phosphatase [Deltaproteobacteria bacterium]|nr:protein-tyrosine-phosphatase [Deltaproteobacteria bacterium]
MGDVERTIDELVLRFDAIPDDRKLALERVAIFVAERVAAGGPIELTFICTHNSRRSHMAQLWAAAAAAHYGVTGVETYSGGTEATSFNPRAVEALKRVGFVIENPGGENPPYRVRYSEDAPTIECFSKTYGHAFNPQRDFVAVMTCSQADRACPVVHGAALRVPIAYDDPKASDGTPEEASTYDARCRQIGAEMLYLFSRARV